LREAKATRQRCAHAASFIPIGRIPRNEWQDSANQFFPARTEWVPGIWNARDDLFVGDADHKFLQRDLSHSRQRAILQSYPDECSGIDLAV